MIDSPLGLYGFDNLLYYSDTLRILGENTHQNLFDNEKGGENA